MSAILDWLFAALFAGTALMAVPWLVGLLTFQVWMRQADPPPPRPAPLPLHLAEPLPAPVEDVFVVEGEVVQA